jgi:NADH-quinone oxidoreductase subunit G
MATLYIDNKPYRFEEGANLLQTCLGLGFDLPYFCWHPAMHSIGACRQCAIKLYRDENDGKGTLVMACMTGAKNGQRISIDDPEARAFRAENIAFLMANHPHDCPVCDEGGECHLQDMTVMTGHTYRTHRFRKRTHRNQELGPFVTHEMNRCIACYRCVRFYRDYAGGDDLAAFAWHDAVYFGRRESGMLESEFSGNLVEFCPTGVFTDKTLMRHYVRKWDMQTAPSVCPHCSVGCNIIYGERHGLLRRVRNRYNPAVNGYCLCDRGRFGYEYVNGGGRIRACRVGKGKAAAVVSRAEAMEAVKAALCSSRRVIGIGSPRASLESNFALLTLVGEEHFFQGVGPAQHALTEEIVKAFEGGGLAAASLRDVQEADAVIILGEDILATAPMLGYAARQTGRTAWAGRARNLGIDPWNDAAVTELGRRSPQPLFIITVSPSKLDDTACFVRRAPPDEVARLGFAVAHILDRGAPEVAGLAAPQHDDAGLLALALARAKKPVVVAGTSMESMPLVGSALTLAAALRRKNPDARVAAVLPHCNSFGLSCLGGRSLGDLLPSIRIHPADTLIVVENDPSGVMGTAWSEILFESVENVIVLDCIETDFTHRAHVAVPSAAVAESNGTFVSGEGRIQRFFKAFAPEGDVRESFYWIRDFLAALGRPEAAQWLCFDDIVESMAGRFPVFKPALSVAPGAEARIDNLKIARQTARTSGRTALYADRDVKETPPPQDTDSPLAFSMEGFQGLPPMPLVQRYWAPGWNSVQALHKYQMELDGFFLKGDPGYRLFEGTAAPSFVYHGPAPGPFAATKGTWLVIGLFHLFGSEELSSLAEGGAGLVPQPYLALNPDDALLYEVNEGDIVKVVDGGAAHRFPAKILPGLPPDVAGIPRGLKATRELSVPAWYAIGKEHVA